jgi:hypothetical protein
MTDDNSVKTGLDNGHRRWNRARTEWLLMRAALVSDHFRKGRECEIMFSTPVRRRAVTYMPSLYHSLV